MAVRRAFGRPGSSLGATCTRTSSWANRASSSRSAASSVYRSSMHSGGRDSRLLLGRPAGSFRDASAHATPRGGLSPANRATVAPAQQPGRVQIAQVRRFASHRHIVWPGRWRPARATTRHPGCGPGSRTNWRRSAANMNAQLTARGFGQTSRNRSALIVRPNVQAPRRQHRGEVPSSSPSTAMVLSGQDRIVRPTGTAAKPVRVVSVL